MKKILAFASLLFMLGCSPTTSPELTSVSSDGKNLVKIYGTKASSLDPFQTRIILSGNNLTDTLVTEIFTGDLNAETVKFTWSDNENCTIEFSQTDNPRIMYATFANGGIKLSENK